MKMKYKLTKKNIFIILAIICLTDFSHKIQTTLWNHFWKDITAEESRRTQSELIKAHELFIKIGIANGI